MWRATGSVRSHKPDYWLNQDGTKRFISSFVKKLVNGQKQSKKSLKAIVSGLFKITRGRNGGTYAHWQIALAYAKYLSDEFHIWCNEVIKDRFY